MAHVTPPTLSFFFFFLFCFGLSHDSFAHSKRVIVWMNEWVCVWVCIRALRGWTAHAYYTHFLHSCQSSLLCTILMWLISIPSHICACRRKWLLVKIFAAKAKFRLYRSEIMCIKESHEVVTEVCSEHFESPCSSHSQVWFCSRVLCNRSHKFWNIFSFMSSHHNVRMWALPLKSIEPSFLCIYIVEILWFVIPHVRFLCMSRVLSSSLFGDHV